MNSDQPSWRVVSEWEQELSRCLNLDIRRENKFSRFVKFRIIDKFKIAGVLNSLKPRRSLSLRFIMKAESHETIFVDKNTVPVIIDFWLNKSDLPFFYYAYRKTTLVLISNLEVYDYLMANNCPLNIVHWPLSYPDKYIDSYENKHPTRKDFEFCIFGRSNPFFLRLLEEYAQKYPDFEYITNSGPSDNRVYVTNKGKIIAKDEGRSSYLEMISRTKISCYSTPGIDESKKESSSFNQVTPRLFEMLSNRCMVIAHYPISADTQWYNLKEYIPNVNNFMEFETVLNKFRKSEFDDRKIGEFLNLHRTSNRAKTLEEILKKNNINIRS